MRRTPGGTVVIDKPYPVPYTVPDLESAQAAIARGLPRKRTVCKTGTCFRWPTWRTAYQDREDHEDEIYTCDDHLATELELLTAAGFKHDEPQSAPEPQYREGPYKEVPAATPYPAPEPPQTERAGVIQMRSMAECVRCETRSGWWFGDMPRTWAARHAAAEHPEILSPFFRLWQIKRFEVWVKPERPLSRTPVAPPPGQPAAFALSECRSCGDSSGWLLEAADGEPGGGLDHFEQKHICTRRGKKEPPEFDRWRLARERQDNP